MRAQKPLFFNTFERDPAAVVHELAQGLLSEHAYTAPKYFYNALGSTLFDAITLTPEYYPTRTEAGIFAEHAAAVHAQIPPQAAWVDLGAGNCQKAAALFEGSPPALYVPVDISLDYLTGTLTQLQDRHPGVPMAGVGMDFSKQLVFPPALQEQLAAHPIFVFYPGSSLGNFDPPEALRFLQNMAQLCQTGQNGSGVMIGIDLVKDARVLEHAYADDLGVTAAFNLNVLRHLNDLLGTDFKVRDWQHVARFNAQASRIEMHLQARKAITVSWPNAQRAFREGETIHTENSYKWTPESFAQHLRQAGFETLRHWSDPQKYFAIFWAATASNASAGMKA